MRLFVAFVLFAVMPLLSVAENRVALPSDYRESFVEYLSLDRVQNLDQFMRLFANDIAMQGRDENGLLPDGAVIVAEVYSVQKNEDGTVKTSELGRRIKDQLISIAVMEKQAEFGQSPSSVIKTGNWDFGSYKPNGEAAAKNLNECRACHAPLKEKDFMFSIEHLPGK
ncbi:cytochrome P460 family protein [bacterium SCSIO 12696]|nr:cytochrome P460 family protein [bacterium SCSIO 12696]